MADLLEWREQPVGKDDIDRRDIRRWDGLLCGVAFFSLAAPTRHNPKWRAFRIALGEGRVHFDHQDEAGARGAAEGWVRDWLAQIDARRTADRAA